MTFFRTAVPSIILLAYFLFKRKNILAGTHKMVLLASFLNGVRMVFYFLAYQLTSIGNAVIMFYTGPIFIALLGFFLLKEKMTYKKIFLTMLAFLGIVFMFSNKELSFSSNDFLGMLSALICTAIFSFTMILFKKEINKYSRLEAVFFQNIVPGILFLPFLFINQPLPNEFQISMASFYALLIGVVGFFLIFSAMKKIDVSTVGVITYLEVVSAIILAYLFFREPVTWNMLIGGSLIVISTISLQKGKRKKESVTIED
jgi:drug/metabolite transporter (DMT)-like permease